MMNTTDLKTEFYQVRFDVQRSVRYHSRRVNFFDGFHQLTLFFALLCGSVTVVAFSSEVAAGFALWVKLIPAVLTSVFALADISFKVSQKARLHERLMRGFIGLEQELVAEEGSLSAALLARVKREKLKIEMDEPPVLRVLDTLCHNELLRANGHSRSEQVRVGWWQRFCAPFFDWREDRLHPQV